MEQRARVGLAHGGPEQRRENVRRALEAVRDEVAARIAEPVLIKPNFLSSSNPLCSTQVDAIRGVLDFLAALASPPRRIIIAEGANEKESGEAFRNFGYTALPADYSFDMELVDLNAESRWATCPIRLADGGEYQVHIPRRVLDAGCTISVAVAKTHDVLLSTLAYKNMVMGSLRKEDRVKMHGYNTHAERQMPREAQCLNANLARVAPFLTPAVAVVDGTVGLQGNGPGGRDTVPLGAAAAGVDVFAVDTVMTRLMGFDPADVGILQYAGERGLGITDEARIDGVGPPVNSLIRAFLPHEKAPLQRQWRTTATPG